MFHSFQQSRRGASSFRKFLRGVTGDELQRTAFVQPIEADVLCADVFYEDATKQQVTVVGSTSPFLHMFYYPNDEKDVKLSVEALLQDFRSIAVSNFRPRSRMDPDIERVSFVQVKYVDALRSHVLVLRADAVTHSVWMAINVTNRQTLQVKYVERMHAKISNKLMMSTVEDFFPDSCAAFVEFWGAKHPQGHETMISHVALGPSGLCVTASSPMIIISDFDDESDEEDEPSAAAVPPQQQRLLLVWGRGSNGDWNVTNSLKILPDNDFTNMTISALYWDTFQNYLVFGTEGGQLQYHRDFTQQGYAAEPRSLQSRSSKVTAITCRQQSERNYYVGYKDGTYKLVMDDTSQQETVPVDLTEGAENTNEEHPITCLVMSPFETHILVGRKHNVFRYEPTGIAPQSPKFADYWLNAQQYIYDDYMEMEESDRTVTINQFKAFGAFPEWFVDVEGTEKQDHCGICMSTNYHCPVAMRLRQADDTITFSTQVLCATCLRQMFESGKETCPFTRLPITSVRFLSEEQMEMRFRELPAAASSSSSSSSSSGAVSSLAPVASESESEDELISSEEMRRRRLAALEASSGRSAKRQRTQFLPDFGNLRL